MLSTDGSRALSSASDEPKRKTNAQGHHNILVKMSGALSTAQESIRDSS